MADLRLRGGAMPSYGRYCPVAKGTEILGDRWTLLIVRERDCGGWERDSHEPWKPPHPLPSL